MRARLQHLWTALALATCASVAIAAPADGGVSDLQNSLAGKVLGVDAAPVRIARAGVDAFVAGSAVYGAGKDSDPHRYDSIIAALRAELLAVGR